MLGELFEASVCLQLVVTCDFRDLLAHPRPHEQQTETATERKSSLRQTRCFFLFDQATQDIKLTVSIKRRVFIYSSCIIPIYNLYIIYDIPFYYAFRHVGLFSILILMNLLLLVDVR